MTPMVVIMDSTMHVHIKAEIPDGGFIADAIHFGSKAAAEVQEYYAKATLQLRHAAGSTHQGSEQRKTFRPSCLKEAEADNRAKHSSKTIPAHPLFCLLEHLEPRSNAAVRPSLESD